MTTGVYAIVNTVTGRRYIGFASDVQHRFQEHRYFLDRDKHVNIDLQEDWHRYGKQSFEFTELEHCFKNRDWLVIRERWWVELENSIQPTYNREPGLRMSKRVLGLCAALNVLQFIPQIQAQSQAIVGTPFYTYCVLSSIDEFAAAHKPYRG